MAFTHALAINKYGNSKLIVATDAAYGTHTTLASAMADAVSGDTIFLRDSVTENVTITPGVNISGWSGGSLSVPSITGTITMTAAGTCTLSNLRLVTNAAALIAVTGSAASILNVNNCFLSMGSDGITFSSSSSSAKITLFNCLGDLTTTAIKVFAHSSAGRLLFMHSNIQNTGASTTASTISAGTLELSWSILLSPITTSGSTCLYAASYSQINCNAINTTALTHGCTNATASASQFGIYSSGTASAISISASCSFTSLSDLIGSNNTNAVTGAGTITFTGMNFFGTSKIVNTTTQTGGITTGIIRASTPSAGFIGEELIATATSVAVTSNTPTTIASITLTPGVWDVTGMAGTTPTGGTLQANAFVVVLNTTTNSVTGPVLGIDRWQYNNAGTFGVVTGVVPSYRVSVTVNTTYYLVVNVVYTSTTSPTNGRIKATRVG